MKQLLKLIAISGMLIANNATAQTGLLATEWTNSGTTTYLTNSTFNVGIGINPAPNKLSVVGNANITGNVGIGTTAPAYKFDVQSTAAATMQFKSTTNNASILLDRGNSSSNASLTYRTGGVSNWQTGCVSTNNYTIRNVGLSQLTLFCDYLTNNIGIGMNIPAAKLHVPGQTAASLGAHGIFVLGDIVGYNIAFDSRDIQARNNGAITTLYQNFYGGDVQLGGTTATNLFIYKGATGNVGVGTATPATKLDVAGPGNWDLSSTQGDFRIGNGTYNIRMGIALGGGGAGYSTIAATTALQLGTGSTYPNLNTLNILGGQVGVGTGTPAAKLDVAGIMAINDNELRLRAGSDDAHSLKYDATINGPLLSGFDGGALGGTVPNATVLRWYWDGSDGKVGIGTNTPAYKLDVCGTIRAKEVRVETGWCDYVFAHDYQLKSIEEVAEYIKENKHLPGITPASQVETEGLKLGEMSKDMMEKIEELTLYVIQLQKEIDQLNTKIDLTNMQNDSKK